MPPCPVTSGLDYKTANIISQTIASRSPSSAPTITKIREVREQANFPEGREGKSRNPLTATLGTNATLADSANSRLSTRSGTFDSGTTLSFIKITSATAPFSPPYNFSKSLVQETTTEGPAVIGSASRNLGGRDEIRSQSSTSERWIPPSAIRRDALPENSDDVKFRKVRGILNKLTPQTFDRLTEELIRIGLDSQVLLKGVILLIFEKALQEPKYVSMYAQLCKKLSKKVPNYDPPNPDNTTTFRRLLLNKCQDEYAGRTRASAMYDQRTGHLTPEEEEEKLLAKRKMLGNIKFIGELGKLEMLTHSILHKCCEELVKKTKAEDLECLCQIMSTCGHLLDNDKGKYLMDQYFDRMKELSDNEKLPARIRFMLQDVIELRDNHWLPRKTISLKESPKPIQEIRREAHDELGISDGNRSPTEDFRYLQIDPRRNGRIFGPKKRTGLEDVFAPVPIAMTSLGTGPGVITGEKGHGMESNGFHTPPPMNNYRPAGGMRGYNPQGQQGNMAPNNGPYYHQQHKNNMKYHHNNHNNHPNLHHNHMNHNNHEGHPHHGQINLHHNMRNNQNNMNNHTGYEKSPVAPRFMKQQQATQGGMGGGAPPIPVSNMPTQANEEQLSFRPPPTAMIKMIPQPMKPPPTFAPPMMDHRKSPVGGQLPPPVISQPPPPVDTSPLGQLGSKGSLERKKNPDKDDIMKRVEETLQVYLEKKVDEDGLEAMKELKISERLLTDVVVFMLNKAMDHNEGDREAIYSFVSYLAEKEFITQSQFQNAFRTVLDKMAELEADIPRIKSYVAAFAGRAICSGQMSIVEVAELTDGGRHYPFLLLVLQQMGKMMERTKLCKLFDESKVNLLNTLPKTDRTKDRMSEILEERELSFLFPLLKIQAEMAKRSQINTNPAEFLEWVKGQVDVTYQTSQGFIHALMTVIFKFINNEALQALGIDGSPTQANEKLIKEKEKELLMRYKPVISTFLQDRVDLQVIAIYSLQSAWFALECPKVMLLRWFMNTYELDLVEEDAFLKWKEDIRDDYPGKGNALFQVNQWLNWLEEEEDDEEDGDGDD